MHCQHHPDAKKYDHEFVSHIDKDGGNVIEGTIKDVAHDDLDIIVRRCRQAKGSESPTLNLRLLAALP